MPVYAAEIIPSSDSVLVGRALKPFPTGEQLENEKELFEFNSLISLKLSNMDVTFFWKLVQILKLVGSTSKIHFLIDKRLCVTQGWGIRILEMLR